MVRYHPSSGCVPQHTPLSLHHQAVCLSTHRSHKARSQHTAAFGFGASLVARTVENLPAMQETWVRPLDQEDPLEKETAVLSSTLAWRIPWTEEPGGLQSVASQESQT